jgi:hypothetical protein
MYGQAPGVVEAFSPGTVLNNDLAGLTDYGSAYIPGNTFNPYDFPDGDAWTLYDAYADGRGINYTAPGWKQGDPLRIYHQKFWYHRETNSQYPSGVYNRKGEWLDLNTITYIFDYVDPKSAAPQLAFEMDEAVEMGVTTVQGKTLQVFGGFFNLTPIAGDQSVNLANFPAYLRFAFSWDAKKNGVLNKNVTLTLDGKPIGSAMLTGGLGDLCAPAQMSVGESTAQSAVDLSKFQLEIPYPTNLTAGSRILGVAFKMANGTSFTREIVIHSDDLPSWFIEGQNFSHRAITYNYSNNYVTFGGKQLNPGDNHYGSGPGEASGEVPNMDPIQNEVKADSFVEQVYIPAHTVGAESVFEGVTAKTTAPNTQAMSNKPTTPPPASGSASDAVNIHVANIPLAYVVMPLYVIAFTDPFGGAIVNGSSGALMTAYATMDMDGYISPS